jgi:hypothetical protein
LGHAGPKETLGRAAGKKMSGALQKSLGVVLGDAVRDALM